MILPKTRFLFCLCWSLLHAAQGRRFSVNGPVLTITVRPPETKPSSTVHLHEKEELEGHTEERTDRPWIDLASLEPHVLWSIQTQQRPIPIWLPSLTAIKAGIGYSYNDFKRKPSRLECTGKFDLGASTELQIQPSYDLRNQRSNLLCQIARGASYLFASLEQRRLQTLKASWRWRLPSATIDSIRVSPSFQNSNNKSLLDKIACSVQAVTGSNTKAILQLEKQNPTLSVVYALNKRNILCPTISLYDAKIVYQWDIQFASNGGGSTLSTKVDPTKAVDLTWTDRSIDRGTWVTDVHVPLEEDFLQTALRAQVQVRRQFVF